MDTLAIFTNYTTETHNNFKISTKTLLKRLDSMTKDDRLRLAGQVRNQMDSVVYIIGKVHEIESIDERIRFMNVYAKELQDLSVQMIEGDFKESHRMRVLTRLKIGAGKRKNESEHDVRKTRRTDSSENSILYALAYNVSFLNTIAQLLKINSGTVQGVLLKVALGIGFAPLHPWILYGAGSLLLATNGIYKRHSWVSIIQSQALYFLNVYVSLYVIEKLCAPVQQLSTLSLMAEMKELLPRYSNITVNRALTHAIQVMKIPNVTAATALLSFQKSLDSAFLGKLGPEYSTGFQLSYFNTSFNNEPTKNAVIVDMIVKISKENDPEKIEPLIINSLSPDLTDSAMKDALKRNFTSLTIENLFETYVKLHELCL